MRNILRLIPTDPKLLESFDKIANKSQNSLNSINNSNISSASNSNNVSMIETSLNTSTSSNKELTPKRNESFSQLDTKSSIVLKDFQYFFNKELPLYRILYHLEVFINCLYKTK